MASKTMLNQLFIEVKIVWRKFCTMIEEEVKEIGAFYKDIIPLEMTADDNEQFQSAVDCHICNKKAVQRQDNSV